MTTGKSGLQKRWPKSFSTTPGDQPVSRQIHIKLLETQMRKIIIIIFSWFDYIYTVRRRVTTISESDKYSGGLVQLIKRRLNIYFECVLLT